MNSRIACLARILVLFQFTDVAVVTATPLVSGVAIQQLNWLRPDTTVAAPNSVWGALSFSVVPDPMTTYYLNVVAANGSTSAWSVQNMPLSPFDVGSQAVDIDFQELGFAPGTDVTSLGLLYSLDSSVRLTAPTGAFNATPVADLDRLAWDEFNIAGPFDPGRPLGIKSLAAPMNNPVAPRDLMPLQEHVNGCFPGSMARSLDWLNRKNNLGNNKGVNDIYLDLATLTGLPPNAPPRELRIEHKASYAHDMHVPQTKIFDATNIVGPVFGVPETTPATMNPIDWLKKEFAHGEDIELAYQWKDAATGQTGGHIVAIADILMTADGKVIVKYRDDEEQGKPLKGDTAVKWAELVSKADGTYGFRTMDDTFTYAVSESVPEPSSWALAVLALASSIGYFRSTASRALDRCR